MGACFSVIHRRFTVSILTSIRSALLLTAALTMTAFAPARAGPSADTLVSVANVTLPKIQVPDLIDVQGEPPETPETDEQAALPAVDRDQDLPSMVADLRSGDAGSRELECLATGIYFESKGEPLAGQLAVGKVIANRANSGGRFPST